MPNPETSEFKRQLKLRGLLEGVAVISTGVDAGEDELAALGDDPWDRVATRSFACVNRECEFDENDNHKRSCA
jgi:hypothetical protein